MISSWSCRRRSSQNIGREEQRLPLCRPARRAGVRPAGLHAPRGDPGFARSADQPSLARFDPHQLRRADRRARARPGQARSQPVQRPRARPASLEHRDRAARFDRGPRFVEPDADARAAGQLGPFRRSRAARAGRRPEALVGERALRARDRAGLEARRNARLGPQDRRTATTTTRSPPRPRSSMAAGPCSAAAR